MVAKKPIRVVVASDQPIYLRGLTALVLSIENARLVGEARTIVETMQLCQMSEPEMVILDLKDAPQQGRQLAHLIIETWPGTRVVVMLAPQDEATGPEDNPGGPVYTFSRDVGEDEFKNAVSQLWQDSNDKARNPAASARAGKASDDELVDVSQITRRGGQSRNEKVIARELVMAGKIQADILPEGAPAIPGWDISARLEPARETSGDFYDFIPLSDRKLGIVVADVTDKGMGAALFMALSSTLIRTYASRFPTLPAFALSAVNERILTDTRGSMFVTAIFAILEPHTGRLVFANAGHPPGYILSGRRGHESIERLRSTGMALGVSEQGQWKQKSTRFSPGDTLIFYTDGITEAQNPQGDFFEEERLLDVALTNFGKPAAAVQQALLDEVHRFVGNAPRQDDIAVIVIRKE